MPLSAAQREQAEKNIRAAIDRLLAGQIPADGGCDAKTLAREAGISRAALYRTYPHLKDEFERRRAAALERQGHPDQREQRITRLTEQNTALTARLTAAREELRQAKTDRQKALSALAAAADTIQQLRQRLAAAERRHAVPAGSRPRLAVLPVPQSGQPAPGESQ